MDGLPGRGTLGAKRCTSWTAHLCVGSGSRFARQRGQRPGSTLLEKEELMQDEQVDRNLKGMDDLDFDGRNKADWKRRLGLSPH